MEWQGVRSHGACCRAMAAREVMHWRSSYFEYEKSTRKERDEAGRARD